MEEKTKQIIALMEEKKLVFEQYEAITDRLSETDNNDAMEDYITKRGDLANKIDALDVIIKKQLEEAFGSEGRLALAQNAPREKLPEELRRVYDSNMSIMEVARRIRLKNSDITAGYQRTQVEMTQKIKETNNQPKINRYLNNLTTAESKNSFGSV